MVAGSGMAGIPLASKSSMVNELPSGFPKISIREIPPAKATPEAFDTVNNIVALVNQYIKKE